MRRPLRLVLVAAAAGAAVCLAERFGPDPSRAGPDPIRPGRDEGAVRDGRPVETVVDDLARESASRAVGGAGGVVTRVDARGGFVGFRDRDAGGRYRAYHVAPDGAGGSRIRTLGDAPAAGSAPLPSGLPDLGKPLFSMPIGKGRPGVMAVFRVEEGPAAALARVDRGFREGGWRADGARPSAGRPEEAPPLLYTRGRQRCLASVAASGEGSDVMILCDQ